MEEENTDVAKCEILMDVFGTILTNSFFIFQGKFLVENVSDGIIIGNQGQTYPIKN